MSLQHFQRPRDAWIYGFLLSSMVAWGGFHWIIYVAQNFGDLPLPLAVGLLLLYCLAAAPAMVVFLLIALRVRTKIEKLAWALRPLFWAALFSGLEYVFHFIKVFPEHLGNTLIAFLPLAQAASLGGVALLSFFPLYFGASLFYLRKDRQKAWPSVLASALLILGFWLWGQREIKAQEALPHSTLRIGIVQHNLEETEKMAQKTNTRTAVEKTISVLLEKTLAIAKSYPDLDLILWPETSYPLVFPTASGAAKSWASDGYANLVKSAVAEAGVPLLFGGYETAENRDYNAGILLDKFGRATATYRKVVLLIGGEYLPLAETFPVLKELNPQMGDFGRGPGPQPISFVNKKGSYSLGVNICYEAILPTFMRGFALNGANLFVNLTKDSWFGNTFEPWQHFQLSVLRSIEHRIPMVRATNTGLSGTVSATGKTHLISEPFQEINAAVEVSIPQQPSKTLYTLWGDWFAWACLLFCAFSLFRAYRI